MRARVLVVDDHADTTELYAVTLTAAGFDVLQTTNAVEAIELAVSELPDVIVTDIWMPEMDGSAMADSIRSRLHPRAIPFIAVSAHAFDLEGPMMPQRGWDACVSKPCLPEDLIAAVRGVLERRMPLVSGPRALLDEEEDPPSSKGTGTRRKA